MKTLFELCKPRDTIFQISATKKDTLEIKDLLTTEINPEEFFEENFITSGMKVLFKNAFDRFHGYDSYGLVKLKQAMGGGKTHNMIALGLLAKYPQIRSKVFTNEELSRYYLNEIKVIVFSGRDCDYPLGLWGAIAEQLGKKEFLKDYYSPLKAPGHQTWIELLKGQPLLILIDELPPYLQNAKSYQIGNSDLSEVTQTALGNLINALNSNELKNVFLVISDLKSAYETGSEILEYIFKNLEGEIDRIALPINPIHYASDEVFHILRKRLFKSLPSLDSIEVNEVAMAYKNAIKSAKQMGLTDISEDQIFTGIKSSYPFHPIIKDLYERFKENKGFHQTRGLLRLMRLIIRQFYNGENPLAKEKYLINPQDYDLNDQELATMIGNINQSLQNAISHDIARNGNSLAEDYDKKFNKPILQEICKLILMASLSNIPKATLGLSENEIIGYLCEPNKDITNYKNAINYLKSNAWYIKHSQDNKIYFQEVTNINAEINKLIDSYTADDAKNILKSYLSNIFIPNIKDCYQKVYIFEALDEIKLDIDNVSLVICFPTEHTSDLSNEIKDFYSKQYYKNKVMFLTGSNKSVENLRRKVKEYKATQNVLERLKSEKNSPSQIKLLSERLDRVNLELLQLIRETFQTLYYPYPNPPLDLVKTEITMNFSSNDYNGEKLITQTLLETKKFIKNEDYTSTKPKLFKRLFTLPQMKLNELKRKAAENVEWQWYPPNTLEDVINHLISTNECRKNNDFIEKGPFVEKTSVKINNIGYDKINKKTILKIIPEHGDKVYFYTKNNPTPTLIENLDHFETNELLLYFYCEDSNKKNITGPHIPWKNNVLLSYETISNNSIKLTTNIDNPSIVVKYTSNGANPKTNGETYIKDSIIDIPSNANIFLAIALYNDEPISNELQIKLPLQIKIIDENKPLLYNKKIQINSYELSQLQNFNILLSETTISIYNNTNTSQWIEITTGKDVFKSLSQLENIIYSLINDLEDKNNFNFRINANIIKFNTGKEFLDYIKFKNISLDTIDKSEIIQ